MKTKIENAQQFQFSRETELGRQITDSIRRILRSKHQKVSSAIKRIQRDTAINARSIRNWYEGRNQPSAEHLIILSKTYPAILHMFLHLAGHSYLTADIYERNVPENVPDELTVDCLNERQKWILFKLALKHKIMPRDIARAWPVSERTAKRDLADLKFRGYIAYVGSAKAGRYILRR